MRVVLTVDVPAETDRVDADAVVVALKSRTVPAATAVEQSLRACRWLRQRGAGQIYFKICSTFDSTAAGNIGPVIEALMDELDCPFSIATPAFPENGRTVVHGHLFLGDTLLSDSGMRHHPLTPMTDANLVRVLQAQLNPGKGRKVGLIDYRTVAQSPEAIQKRINELKAEGIAIAIVDALNDEDLGRLGAALRDSSFLTAGSGLGGSLPRNWGFSPQNQANLPPARGLKAILAGSCSVATNAQVQNFIRNGGEAYALQPAQLAADLEMQIAEVLAWADACWRTEAALPLLVYSTAEPEKVNPAHAPVIEAGDGRLGARLREARRWQPGGRRRRNCGHLRTGSRYQANTNWPADRSRRAVVLRAGGPPPRFEIRKLWIARLFLESVCLCGVSDERDRTKAGDLSGRPLSL